MEENAAAAAAATAASAIPHMPTMMQIPAAEGSAEDEKEKALEVAVTVKDADTCHELAGERKCVWLAENP